MKVVDAEAGIDDRLAGLARDSERLRDRVEALERRPAPPGPEQGPGSSIAPAPPAAAAPTAGQSAPEIFQRAYADYAQGHYDLAESGFLAFLQLPDAGALADDAQYYLAEIDAARGRTEAALKGYGLVASRYPDADKVPAAALKKGLLLIDLNRHGEGILQLDHLVRTYPQSDEARLARNKLRALGVGP